jgi:hypothetical protein
MRWFSDIFELQKNGLRRLHWQAMVNERFGGDLLIGGMDRRVLSHASQLNLLSPGLDAHDAS